MSFSQRFQHKMSKINRQGSLQQINSPPVLANSNPRNTKLSLHSMANATGPSLSNLKNNPTINKTNSFIEKKSISKTSQLRQIRTERKSYDGDLGSYHLQQNLLSSRKNPEMDKLQKQVIDKKQYYQQNDFMNRRYIDIMLERHSNLLRVIDRKTKWN